MLLGVGQEPQITGGNALTMHIRGFTGSVHALCSTSFTSVAWSVSYSAVQHRTGLTTSNAVVTEGLAIQVAMFVYWEEKDISTLYPWTQGAGPAQPSIAGRCSNKTFWATFITLSLSWVLILY